jgi:hypothetical protein
VSEQQDQQQTAELDHVNEELTRSLKLCHSLVDDYRLKLVANSNDLELAEAGDEERLG